MILVKKLCHPERSEGTLHWIHNHAQSKVSSKNADVFYRNENFRFSTILFNRALVQKNLKSELILRLDGKPLPDSSADPFNQYKTAYGIVFFIGGLNLFLGLVAMLLQNPFLQRLGLGLFSIIYGAVFIGLGFYIKRRSQLALILTRSILIIDGILFFGFNLSAGQLPNTAGLIGRVFFFIPMILGVEVIRELPTHDDETDHIASSST